MVGVFIEVVRHEIHVLLRTRRALLLAGLYLIAALLGGFIYVVSMRFAEQKAIDLLMARGMSLEDAIRSIELGAGEFARATAWFANTEVELLAPFLRDSIILPMFFWCSLAFLPFLILMSSFDLMSAPLQSRSICYSMLRVRRLELLLAKATAHLLVFVLLTFIASTLLLFIGAAMLEKTHFGPSFLGLLHLMLYIIPFGATYVAITTFCSTLTKNPFTALVGAFAVTIVLRAFSWTSYIPDDHAAAALRLLRFLSPETHQDGMWLAGWSGPLQSVGAYLAFTAVFLALAGWVLGRRDL